MSFRASRAVGAEWCDYCWRTRRGASKQLRTLAAQLDMEDQVADANRGGGSDDGWVSGGDIIFCRDTFLLCAHRQARRTRRGKQRLGGGAERDGGILRKAIFPIGQTTVGWER